METRRREAREVERRIKREFSEAYRRKPGRLRYKIRIASGFDALLPKDIARGFRGEGD